ncbi:MAG: periplasmic heavy metal sensor [Bryobacterales bacterium]|nr:periplasmic heavy metal sensor [Bryobacterales bacterium]
MKNLTMVLLLAAAAAAAQEPPPLNWWDRPVAARALKLSPEQEKQVRAVQREFRDRLLDQQTAVRKAEANLQDLMNEDQVNEARTREAIDRVVAARGELMRTVSNMALRMRLVLTPEQWQRVRDRRMQTVQQRRQQRPPAAGSPEQPAPPAPAKPVRPAKPRGPVY